MVCLILISTAFGFRFLSKAVGRHGGLMALWIVPVILSWPLFMGFHNYCLGLSFSLWGYGIWLRARGTNKRKLWTVFLLIVVLVLFTHPVPLLFLLGITLLDLTVRVFQEKSTGKATWNAIAGRMKWDIACSLIGCLALFYTSLFIEKNMAGRVLPIHISRWEMLSGFARLQWMCFGTGGLSTKLYRIGLYGALALGFALGIQRFRARPTTRRGVTAEPLLIAALFLMIVLPFLPPNMNGSEHFADRLPILVWICVLAAASSAARLNPAARNAIAVFGFVFSVTTLAFADRLIRPAASDIARIERVPVTKHKMGLLLDGPTQVQDDRLTFNPYLRWVGGRYFRRSDAVLLNAPWLSPPFPLPIQRRQNRFTSEFSPLDLLDPATLHNRLMNSAADRESLLSSVDVLLFIGKPQQGPSPDPLLTLDAARRWKCTASEWYFVCERTQQGFSSTLASASMPRSQHRRVETSR